MKDLQKDHLKSGADILRTEANQLAHYLEHTLKTQVTLRTQEIISFSEMTPHRVSIAVSNEIKRLRGIAETLEGLAKQE